MSEALNLQEQTTENKTVQKQGPTEAERRRQSIRDRQNNRAELAKRPGSTVIQPQSPAVTFEVIYNVRRIDQAMAEISRNVFQDGTDFDKLKKAGETIEKMKKVLADTAKELSSLANIQYTAYQPQQRREPVKKSL